MVELMAVIALVGLLAGIGSISLRGNGGALQLSTVGNRCAGLLENARDSAVLQKVPVAVVILPSQPQTMAALAYQPDSKSWKRISKWETLPSGLIFDTNVYSDSNSALSQNSPTVSPALPVLTYNGTDYSPGNAGYGFLVFLPSGALQQSHSRPGMLRLTQGTADGGTFQKTGSTTDFLDVCVNPATGRLKIARME
jgi:Tfp pilus assembly protein FimT